MLRPKRTPVRRHARRATSLVGAAFLALAAAACNTTEHASRQNLVDADYRLRHPILFSEEAEAMDIPVGMNGGDLSPSMKRVVGQHVVAYHRQGRGSYYVQVPVGAANDVAAAEVGAYARRAAIEAGISPAGVQLIGYQAHGRDRPAPIRLSFLRMKPSVPSCGIWPSEHLESAHGKDMHNLGCANQANFAAMVEDSGDLLHPRATDPANGERRAKVINDYAQGKETKSASELNDVSAEDDN